MDEARGTTRHLYQVGERVPPLALESVGGETVAIPDPTRLVHLQFRRFAGCPICNLHLRTIARRHADIEATNVREVAVFHSNADEMREHGSLPFAVIADPGRELYRAFGVEASARSLLDPRSWLAATRGLFVPRPSVTTLAQGGPLGLPGDFLIDPRGVIVACKYGVHADDQWSVDELLELAGAARAADPLAVG